MEKKIAIYAGTFDPMTNGHLDVITRASRIFDRVVVAVGMNSSKKTLLDLEERKELISKVCIDLENVDVQHFEGLIVDFANKIEAKTLVRGIRTEADFVYEMQMAMMNSHLSEKLETIFIPTKQSLSHVSSSLVKEVVKLGGDVSALVPKLVYQNLVKKFE